MSGDDAGFDKDGKFDFDRFAEFIVKRFDSLQEQINGLQEQIKPLASIEQGVINLGTRMEAVEGDIESLKENLAFLQENITSLNAKVDERLQDTRPLWESVSSQLTELREGQDKIKLELWALRTAFGRSYGDLITGQEMPERRISDLEKKAS